MSGKGVPAVPRRRVVISVYAGDVREYEVEIKDLTRVETEINNHPERDFRYDFNDFERWFIRSGRVTVRWER